MKKKILLLVKIPPPLTGATLMNHYVINNKLIQNVFNISSILVSYTRGHYELGNIQIRKLFIFFKVFFVLIKQLIIIRPHLVYFQISPVGFAFIRDFIFVLAIKLSNTRIIYHLHGKGIKRSVQKNFLFRFIYKFTFKNEYIICLSKPLIADIKDIYNGKPFIVGNALKPVNMKDVLKKQSSNIQLLFLGKLNKSKGVLDLIEALYLLKKKNKDFHARIVGPEGDLVIIEIETYLKKYNLSANVELLGPKFDNDKYDIFLNSDVFVYPTLKDTWGLVILEAMQFALPVVSTYEGSIPEIVIDGLNGYLVEKNNPAKIAKKLEILIGNPDKIKEMGENGRRHFNENYTVEVFDRNLLEVFSCILN